MSSRVIINDFSINRRFFVNIEKEDFDMIELFWDNPDKILDDLQSNYFFEGRKSWSKLSPTHYRLLITKNLTYVAALTEAERADKDNNVVKSLRFLLTALIYALETKAESLIELMKITRIDEFQVVFDYTANINIPLNIQKPEEKKPFTVIVDNESGE
jgi:pantothenate kinase